MHKLNTGVCGGSTGSGELQSAAETPDDSERESQNKHGAEDAMDEMPRRADPGLPSLPHDGSPASEDSSHGEDAAKGDDDRSPEVATNVEEMPLPLPSVREEADEDSQDAEARSVSPAAPCMRSDKSPVVWSMLAASQSSDGLVKDSLLGEAAKSEAAGSAEVAAGAAEHATNEVGAIYGRPLRASAPEFQVCQAPLTQDWSSWNFWPGVEWASAQHFLDIQHCLQEQLAQEQGAREEILNCAQALLAEHEERSREANRVHAEEMRTLRRELIRRDSEWQRRLEEINSKDANDDACSDASDGITDHPLDLNGYPIFRVVAPYNPHGDNARKQIRVVKGELFLRLWRQPAEEGAYWAWGCVVTRKYPEYYGASKMGYVPLRILSDHGESPEATQTSGDARSFVHEQATQTSRARWTRHLKDV